MADTRSDEQKAKDANKILEFLKLIRLPYEPMIDNILTYIYHSRRLITEKDAQKGNQTGLEVYDDTALGALNLLADGLHGYLVSPAIRWFSLALPGKLNFPRYSRLRGVSGKSMDEIPEVKTWLESCEEVLYAAFLRSNFYEMTPEFFRDGASIGTVTAICDEDLDRGRIIFTVPHFRECFLHENKFGQVDINYRLFKLTLRQMADKFGMETMKELDAAFEQTINSNPFTEREVIHAIYPRKDYDKERRDAQNKPWVSQWVMQSPLKLVSESGYDENPAITWRWRKNQDEIYGRSPAWDAYVTILKTNQMGRTNLIAGHKMAEPAMVGPADLRGKVNKGPDAWTWVDAKPFKDMLPQPLITGIQLPFALEMQDREREIIREFFHADFFLLLSQAAFNKVDITATQVIEMQGEKAAILGTRVGRLQSEFLNPIIDRVFNIEMRAGRIPPSPQILMDLSGGTNIEVDYLGPLAQAQKRLFKSQSLRAGISAIGELGQIFPEALDKVDPDVTADELLDSAGFPAKARRSVVKVEEIRKLRQQQREAAAAVEQAATISKALPGAGKAVEPGSPLSALSGLVQPGGTA